jgi:hypothetical protein
MKNVLYILLIIPLFGFTQGQVDCSLLTVTDVIIQNDSITFEIYNADIMDSHYPYVSYSIDANGDTIQKGQLNWYVTPAGSASYYSYTNYGLNFVLPSNLLININYPLSIYFTYSNLTGDNPGDYTCELLYNPQMNIVNAELNQEKTLIKTIDILGREVKESPHKILIDIYDDGTSKKRIQF